MVNVAGETATVIPEFATTFAVSPAELTEPGSGFLTVTVTLPTCPDVAVPVAVSCVEEVRVVVSAVLPNTITAFGAKCAPVTLMLNEPTETVDGVIAETWGTGFCKVTAEEADFVASAVCAAVIVITFDAGGNSGAVYIPAELIVPSAALPPAVPFTDHATAGLLPSAAVYENDWLAPPRIVALCGVTNAVPGCGFTVPLPKPAHPAKKRAIPANTASGLADNPAHEPERPVALRFTDVPSRMRQWHSSKNWRLPESAALNPDPSSLLLYGWMHGGY